MNYSKWLKINTSSLSSMTVAITGSTGGIGKELSRYCAALGADIILLDRSETRSKAHRDALIKEFPSAKIKCISADLEEIDSVRSACDELENIPLDIFIHNAGAYSIPRHICSTGFDNVFQINFVSPYYMIRRLLPHLATRKGKALIVGSIAHNYSKIDTDDIDFHTRKKSSLVYGNAKRYLMFSLSELFADRADVRFSISHPGITFTNITAHYPKLIFAIIKHPMKIIFMRPKKATLSILRGLFEDCGYHEWIGPRIFNIWGMPKRRKLRTCKPEESRRIAEIAEEIYSKL